MLKTPIRYAGAKSRAIKKIVPHLPPDLKTLVSPFIGGGSLEVYVTNLNINVIGYDIFNPLQIFWKELLSNNENLYEFLLDFKPNKETFSKVKDILLTWEYTQEMFKDWKTDFYKRSPVHLSDLEVAGFYFFSHNTSYGPAYLGWPSSVYLNDVSWGKTIEEIKHFKTDKLAVLREDFNISIPNHINDFLYLDPPYYMGGEDNKMHKPIYPAKNFPVHHDNFDHIKLRNLLESHKGGFILSYNNCEDIRNLYKGFKFEFPKWKYTMGNGETRIGTNKITTGNVTSKESHEILIIKK
jgi:DNA adenine methylase